eukprot:ctg_673.g435
MQETPLASLLPLRDKPTANPCTCSQAEKVNSTHQFGECECPLKCDARGTACCNASDEYCLCKPGYSTLRNQPPESRVFCNLALTNSSSAGANTNEPSPSALAPPDQSGGLSSGGVTGGDSAFLLAAGAVVLLAAFACCCCCRKQCLTSLCGGISKLFSASRKNPYDANSLGVADVCHVRGRHQENLSRTQWKPYPQLPALESHHTRTANVGSARQAKMGRGQAPLWHDAAFEIPRPPACFQPCLTQDGASAAYLCAIDPAARTYLVPTRCSPMARVSTWEARNDARKARSWCLQREIVNSVGEMRSESPGRVKVSEMRGLMTRAEQNMQNSQAPGRNIARVVSRAKFRGTKIAYGRDPSDSRPGVLSFAIIEALPKLRPSSCKLAPQLAAVTHELCLLE